MKIINMKEYKYMILQIGLLDNIKKLYQAEQERGAVLKIDIIIKIINLKYEPTNSAKKFYIKFIQNKILKIIIYKLEFLEINL